MNNLSKYFCVAVAITFFPCKTDQKTASNEPQNSNPIASTEPLESDKLEGTWAPAEIGEWVYHYVCPDRCDGGVLDNPGTCPICGKTMQHNSAYHVNNNNPTETPAADRNIAQGPRNTSFDPQQSPHGLWHFVCPNEHEGAGEAGDCPICGEPLLHNEDYHIDSKNPDATPQNERGDWHFKCPDGHEGGAAFPGKCEVCGKDLVHNEIYHR